MAMLKDTVVSGSLRATDSLLTTTLQTQIIKVPHTAGGTDYGTGTNKYVLLSNGSSAYWGTETAITKLGTISAGTWQGTTIGTAYGGTGNTSFTQWGVIYANPATKLVSTAAGTSGYLLQGNGSAAPSWIQATNANIGSTIVKRDASGNFSAEAITASTLTVSGNQLYVGSTSATAETDIVLYGPSGSFALFSHASDGAHGLWAYAHGTDTTGKNVFYLDTNNNVLFNGTLDGNATTATTATYVACPDTRSTALNPSDLTATTMGLRLDFKQKSITGLAAAYSGVLSFRPYSNASDWSGGPAHQLAFDANGLHRRKSTGDTTWGEWSDIFDSRSRTDIGTSPNFDDPGFNGFFEVRHSSETTGETGTKPANNYYGMLTMKTSDNITMFQLAGSNVQGWWIRGKQAPNVTLASVDWQRIVVADSGTYAINISGNATTATTASYLSAPEASGFTTDGSGNFTHKRTTNTDYWHLNKNAGNAIFSVYWETGEISSTGNMTLTKNGDSYFEVKCPDTGVRVELDNSGSTNHGLWSSGYWNGSAYTASNSWMIYRNASGTTIVNGNCTGSSGSCTGNAATATTATYCPRLTRIADNTAATDTTAFSTDGLNVRWYSAAGKISGQPTQYGFLFTVATGASSDEVHQVWMEQPNGGIFHRGTNSSTHASPPAFRRLWSEGDAVTNAVWNDLAECRKSSSREAGYAITPAGSRTTKRLEPACRITSDTWGFALGNENDETKMPVAISGRVLAYPYRPREEYHLGDCVCSAPDGKIDIMTREEIRNWPDCIIGMVNEIPDYDEWGPDQADYDDRGKVKVNGRIWIDIK